MSSSNEVFGAYRGGTYTRAYLTMFWLMGAAALGVELVADRQWTPLAVVLVIAAMGVVVLVGTAQTVLTDDGMHQVLQRRSVPWTAVAQVLDPLPGETELRLCLTDGTVLTARGVPPRQGPAVRAVVRRAHPGSRSVHPVLTLRSGAAFAGLLLTFTVVMIGTTVPTPMYSLYAAELGFSGVVSTVVFAVYAVGVLLALLVLGRWSDTLGRRPMLLAGIGCALVSSLVFVTAGPVPQLLVGRFFSGLSAGIFAGTATAAVIEAAPERWKQRAPFLATGANTGGLGLGPLLAGVAVQLLPSPLHLSFAVHLVALMVVGLVVLAVPETVDVAPGARPPRLQRLGVPVDVRALFVSAATAGFAGFAVLGLFTAVSPRIVGEILGIDNHVVVGLVPFLLLGSSTVAQVALRGLPRAVSLDVGCVALAVGILLVTLSLVAASFPALVAGAVVAGAGQGTSFSAGLASVTAQVPPERRAGVTSTFFVVLYVAISVPVVGEGLAAQVWGLRTAGIVFTVAAAALALLALASLLQQQRVRTVAGPSTAS